MPETIVDFSSDHLLKLMLWVHYSNSLAGRKGGEALLTTLADLARDKPEAFDRLAPTIMKKAEQALQGV